MDGWNWGNLLSNAILEHHTLRQPLAKNFGADSGSQVLAEPADARRRAWREYQMGLVKAKDWQGVLDSCSSWQRLDAYLELLPMMTDQERRQLFPDAWIRSDGGVWRNRRRLVTLLHEIGYCGDMDKPSTAVTLFRGASLTVHGRGLSWTLDIGIARRFARPFGRGAQDREGYVFSVMVAPDAILAGFNARDEREYVVDPILLPRLKRVATIPAASDG